MHEDWWTSYMEGFSHWLRHGTTTGFPGGSVVKNTPASAGDTWDKGLIPGSERLPGGRNSNPPQYSCLENYMDGGAGQASVHEVLESQTRLSTYAPWHHHTSFRLSIGLFMWKKQKQKQKQNAWYFNYCCFRFSIEANKPNVYKNADHTFPVIELSDLCRFKPNPLHQTSSIN